LKEQDDATRELWEGGLTNCRSPVVLAMDGDVDEESREWGTTRKNQMAEGVQEAMEGLASERKEYVVVGDVREDDVVVEDGGDEDWVEFRDDHPPGCQPAHFRYGD
jgi:hypothetical protein